MTLLIGDNRETLKELPAGSVDCIVTSPPYWNLRDYGTATWEGGRDDCDHTYMTGGYKTTGLNCKRDADGMAGVVCSGAAQTGKLRLGYARCRPACFGKWRRGMAGVEC
jgi:DNA modification methylase